MLVPANSPLISEEVIQARIQHLAGEIARIVDSRKPLVLIGLLRGCLSFTADLMRELSRHQAAVDEIDFIIASSYGGDTVSSGVVALERDINRNLKDCQVLLIDDILDTGRTLSHVRTVLQDQRPHWLKTCVLLVKPERRIIDIHPDFYGFEIPDEFVVGYGLDYDQKYRELPYITVLKSAE